MTDISILLKKIVFLILQSLLKIYFITQFRSYKVYNKKTFDIIIAYLVCTVPKVGAPYN